MQNEEILDALLRRDLRFCTLHSASCIPFCVRTIFEPPEREVSQRPIFSFRLS